MSGASDAKDCVPRTIPRKPDRASAGRFHVPVASDHARAVEATSDRTHVLANQLVLVVHADRVLEVDRYQVEATFCDDH